MSLSSASPTTASSHPCLGILPTLDMVKAASPLVYAAMAPTPQHSYPVLNQRTGCTVWVKHDNHTLLGAFKMRGGLVYMHHLLQAHPTVTGVISATKGNHGQSVAFAAGQYGLNCTIVVPNNNSACTNRAMQALGATVIRHGDTFQEAIAHANALAAENGWHSVPGFHPWLLEGVATGALELFSAVPELDAVYVAVGKGSGICSAIAMRNALSLKTEIIGVVAEQAPAYAQAYSEGLITCHVPANTMACGIAVEQTEPASLAVVQQQASRIVQVSETQIQQAMAVLYEDTHNVACGAGAAGLAALLAEKNTMAGKRVAVILSGSNVDATVWTQALQGGCNQ
jgi:threonine dehydratase